MKRITVNNEFTQWAEYLARYFGDALAIYDNKGNLMWGDSTRAQDKRLITELKNKCFRTVEPVDKGIGEYVAYLDYSQLTDKEVELLKAIVPFIESQLDDEGA